MFNNIKSNNILPPGLMDDVYDDIQFGITSNRKLFNSKDDN